MGVQADAGCLADVPAGEGDTLQQHPAVQDIVLHFPDGQLGGVPAGGIIVGTAYGREEVCEAVGLDGVVDHFGVGRAGHLLLSAGHQVVPVELVGVLVVVDVVDTDEICVGV